MKLSPGVELGAYRIVKFLKQGGMSQVYVGHQSALDRLVAIKVLMAVDPDDATSIERFQIEARAIAHLHHPNIVQVFDFGHARGLTYLVLEFVEGGTLAERMGSPWPLEDAVDSSIADR
jgi:serine/threonine protein kinase